MLFLDLLASHADARLAPTRWRASRRAQNLHTTFSVYKSVRQEIFPANTFPFLFFLLAFLFSSCDLLAIYASFGIFLLTFRLMCTFRVIVQHTAFELEKFFRRVFFGRVSCKRSPDGSAKPVRRILIRLTRLAHSRLRLERAQILHTTFLQIGKWSLAKFPPADFYFLFFVCSISERLISFVSGTHCTSN